MDDLDALLADLETTTSHIAKRPVLLSDPLLGPQAVSSDTGLGQVYSNGTENDVRPPPPAYTPQQTVSTAMKSGPLPQVKDAERLYSTVCKPKSPKTKEQMGLSSSSVLGGGLNELDHLLQELNATQFNITDEILAQFPSSKTDEAEKLKQFQASVINSPKSKDETAAASTGSGSGQSLKPSATAATLELDKLMASLSDFKVQTNPPDPALQPTSTAIYLHPLNSGVPTDLQDSPSPSSSAPAVTPPRPTAPPPPQSSGSLDSMLGLLQSDLTRQGIPTTAKGTCAACQKPIVSQVVTALGQTWHPEHFVCTHCQKEIGASNFFEKDGLPYCEEDYFMLFSPRCGLCNQPILDKMVTALDKNWHPEHFCCVKCGRPFGEEGFHERDGKQYCQKDFFAMFATRCQGCSQPILENYISALNVLWHPECFVCRECYTPFINGSFFEHEGQPLCETHYHRSRGSLCSACEKPITGRCITAMGAKFHPEHFVCAFCLKQLNKGTFKEQGDKPYCHPCFFKLFG